MSRAISDLHPLVQGLCRRHMAVCEAEGVPILIYNTYRSIEEQDALYAQGRTLPGKKVTNARGGESLHNYRLAYDCCPTIGGKPIWNDPLLWERIGVAGERVGLEWGGRWRRLVDKPHFQYTFGLTIADLKSGKELPTVG